MAPKPPSRSDRPSVAGALRDFRTRYNGARSHQEAGMNVAERMGRLGTESAFEVLARAKALERQGQRGIPPAGGGPGLATPEPLTDAAQRAPDPGAPRRAPPAGAPPARGGPRPPTTATRR